MLYQFATYILTIDSGEFIVFQIPLIIESFHKHNHLKKDFLQMIEESVGCNTLLDGEKVTKSDWQYPNHNSEYIETLMMYFNPILKRYFKNMHYDRFEMGRYWFQQYETNDHHEWHRHSGSDWNLVYYLELPEDSPATEFRNPLNSEETYTANVKEGDFILFPSLLEHRSSFNKSKGRKTVIAVNFKTIQH